MATKKNLRALKALGKRKAFKAKKKALKKLGLMNWPPSRGPQPKWMSPATTYLIPNLKIEMVEWVHGPKGRRAMVPASLPERVVTPPLPGQKRGPVKMKVGVAHKIKDIIAASNTQRAWSLSLGHHVDTMATLTGEQWGLVGGAALVRRLGSPSKKYGAHYASYESFLPDDKAIIVDITYPLNKIARVTVEPFRTKFKLRDGKVHTSEPRMSVGYLLWALARAYQKVYEEHEAYGVWGHAIGDLVFERLEIKDNIGVLSVGS
jgi:hypothetical protein